MSTSTISSLCDIPGVNPLRGISTIPFPEVFVVPLTGMAPLLYEYINGIPLGKHRYFYPNGKLKEEGKYDSGMKEGDWKKYNADGQLILTILYKNGIEFKYDGFKFKPGLDSIE